ncbi:hypothetical protein PL8927_550014 [Planktothrix serta PCC 8927]|uniref:Uncharacterized protein n=1 Tax=Planktothrix serta PCC 8927 TaxID=671068 RepID=A0A7Z9BKV1_9CYAN|nr:hypothetical protein PL8927_550014 [Planktothrix serta PCC 8927]
MSELHFSMRQLRQQILSGCIKVACLHTLFNIDSWDYNPI